MATPNTEELPPTEAQTKAAELSVYNSAGEAQSFSSLYSSSKEVLVVFIRHFYCGNCQDYVRALSTSASLAPAELEKKGKRLVIVGCGEHSVIEGYRIETGCPFEIFTDPSGKLYDALKMESTLNTGQKPEYIKQSVISGAWNGVVSAFKSGPLKGGNIKRVGGEWLYRDGALVFCHRMKNTRDHLEVKDIVKILSLEE